MEENNKITKIVVNSEDELTDVVTGILNAQTERIIITFAEQSDLLISSINLSVIKETAQEAGKMIICQIIKNPTGIRNAGIAGITTIDTPNNPTNDVWEMAQKQEVEKKDSLKPADSPEESNHTESAKNNPSDFEKRINEAILKSKSDIEKKKDTKTVEHDGIIISVGEDLPTIDDKEEFVDLSKIDFKDVTDEEKTIHKPKKVFKWPQLFKKSPIVSSTIQNVPPLKKKIRKLLPIIISSFVFISVLVGIIYFNTVPFVKVRIFVKAQSVSIEKTFTGDSNINTIDFEALKIPIKTETVEKARSTTVTATGTTYEGEKAKGTIVITHPCSSGSEALNLPAGQIVTSSDGKTYTLDSATTIECNNVVPVSAAVTATDIGEEYNTSNSYFTVKGYSSSDVIVYKSGEFTGGSKTQYTILSLADVNTASKSLEDSATAEAEQELKDRIGDWTIIEDSIESEIKKDSIVTDVAVGAHATQANLSLTVTSSATFYLNTGFDDGVAALLTAEAQAKNLFESDQNLELELGDDITKEVTVAQNNANGVLIKLIASGSVQPKIDKAKISTDLQGKDWEEGSAYLDGLKYSDKATVYEFSPANFPKSLYYFPKRQGGILVEVVDI